MADEVLNEDVSVVPTSSPALSTDLIARALELLDEHDKCLNARLVNKEFCRRFNHPEHLVARFRLPLPPSASDASWQPHLRQAYRQLTFTSKVNTLAVAVSSGSEVNLELAWGLVQPSVSLVGLAHTTIRVTDPGAAAVRSGHLHLLPWLVQHGCADNTCKTISAALEHCSRQEVQHVWGLLGCDVEPYFSEAAQENFAEVAARCADPGMAKLKWLLSVLVNPKTQRTLGYALQGAAVGAAASGKLDVLQWLCQQQGLELLREGAALLQPAHNETLCGRVLSSALQHDHVAVAEWLVDEVGCHLPLEQEQQRARQLVWRAAGAGGSGAAVRWLLDRGVPVHEAGLVAAAEAGKLETVRLLHEDHGVPLTEQTFEAAAGSSSMATATWPMQAGCPRSWGAYLGAAKVGDASMLRWLVQDAHCPWSDGVLMAVAVFWPSDTADAKVQLESVVRELAAAGLQPGGGTDRADSVGYAAQIGHLALARYLHEELGVAFAPGTLALAAAGGCELMVEWLVGSGCVLGEGADMNPYTEAGRVGDVDAMACLRRLGVPWSEDVLGVAVYKEVPLPSIRWLVEQGAPWDEDAVRFAVREARACSRAGFFRQGILSVLIKPNTQKSQYFMRGSMPCSVAPENLEIK